MFPKTKNSLWDPSKKGHPIFLHLGRYSKLRICIPERIVKLVQHQWENYGQGRHVLVGSLVFNTDGEGLQIQVDRLDTRANVSLTTAGLAGVAISLQVTNDAVDEIAVPAEDYVHALELLQNRCYTISKTNIDLSELIQIYGWGTFYSTNLTTVAHLGFDLVTLGTTFTATRIKPVPLMVTALSRNLASSKNFSSLQGTPETGYVTMDGTRKAMLVLESDPKCATLPVVGIWISGVDFLHHPFVWAACLRYTYCTYLKNRKFKQPEEFLLIRYKKLQARPEFYQCTTNSGDSSLQFELNTGHGTIIMDKILASPGTGDFLQVEMDLVQDGQKRKVFETAIEQHKSAAAKHAVFNRQDDLEPRCAPMPHAEQVPVLRPMVLDVSVCEAEPFEHVTSADPMSGQRNNEFAPHQKPASGSQVEMLSQQRYPEQNFTRPLTIPANGQRMTGPLQQPLVLQTRSPLSYRYSPAGQHQGATVSSFQQLLPQNEPTPHSQHNFHVNGHGISPTTVLQTYPTYPQNTSSQHVTTPAASYHFTAPASQTSQPMISSSHVNYNDSKTTPASHNRNQSLPEFTSVGYNIQDWNCYISPNVNTEVHQNIPNSQFMNTSVAKGGQQAGIIPPEAYIQASTVNEQDVNLVLTSSQHNFHVNGHGISPFAPTTVLQTYSTYPQNTSSQHVTTPAASYHFTAPASQTSQPMISSSHVNYNDSKTTPASHNRNQSLPEFTSVGYNIQDWNCYISPNVNTEVHQNIPNSQFMNTSVAKGGQQAGIIPPETYIQACTVNGQGANLIPPVTCAYQHHHPSSNKGLQHCKEALKTINEEGSLSPFSKTTLQPISGVMEVNDQTITAKVNRISMGGPSFNSTFRSNIDDNGLDVTSNRLHITLPCHGADSLISEDSYLAPPSSSCAQQITVENIRWEKIPPNVMTYVNHLSEQHKQMQQQIKQLQQQIHILMSEKAQRSQATPPDINSRNHQNISMAVNTSFSDDLTEADSETIHSVFGTDRNTKAMKYISDENLAQTAKRHQIAPSRSHSSAYSAKNSDESQFGMSPPGVSIDTWRYFQRHQLTGNDRSTVGVSMLGTDLKLRTDFSILTNGSSENINLSPETEIKKAQFLQLHADPEMRIDQVLSPIRFKAHNDANNENWLAEQARNVGGYKDMGASPMLPASNNPAKVELQGYNDRDQNILHSRRRNVLQEVLPQAFINKKTFTETVV